MARPRNLRSTVLPRSFTDRIVPRQAFKKEYALAKEHPDEYFLLCYHGIGGIGKTELMNQLIRENFVNHDTSGYYIKYDFEKSTDMCVILSSLRNMLVKLNKQKFMFLRFDLAFLKYSETNGENMTALTEQKQNYVDSNPMLRAALEVGGAIPVISSVAQVIKAVNESKNAVVDEIYKTKTRNFARELSAQMDNELLRNLPRYFIEDLCQCTKKLSEPLVIFLDTYEKFSNSLGQESGEKEQWLVNPRFGILPMSSNILWVIAGRDQLRLDWESLGFHSRENYPEGDAPDDCIENKLYLLGQFSRQDALRYMESAGMASEYRNQVYQLTQGNPLWLNIALDEYQLCMDHGRKYDLSTIPTAKDLLGRYLKYMDLAMQDLTKELAVLGWWTQDMLRVLGPLNITVYTKLCHSCFIIQDEDGYYMHNLVRKVVCRDFQNESPEEYKMLLEKVDQYYGGQIAIADPKEEKISLLLIHRIDLRLFHKEFNLPITPVMEDIERLYKAGSYSYSWTAIEMLYGNLDRIPNEIDRLKIRYTYICQMNKLQGCYGQTLILAEKLAAEMCQVLGENNALTMRCTATVGMLYHLLGRKEEALALAEKIYNKSCELYGMEDPATLAAANALSVRFAGNGQLERALELSEFVYKTQCKNLGPEEWATMISENNLGIRYGALGRYEEAIAMDRHIYEIRLKKLGPDHLGTLCTYYNLADHYHQVGRNEEALEIVKSIYTKRMQILGPEHPHTKNCEKLMAKIQEAIRNSDSITEKTTIK